MAKLTPFQSKCEAGLVAELARVGATLTDRQLDGIRETYVKSRIDGTDLDIYIYADEAQIQSKRVDARFESTDFKTPDQLCEAFIRKAVELAKEAVA